MPEVRLIDANALYEKVDESQAHNNHKGIAHSVHNAEHAHFKFMIHQAPTIEAEPVRHGRWIKSDVYTFKKCSECGAIWDAALCENIFFIYCPRCGSKNGVAENG